LISAVVNINMAIGGQCKKAEVQLLKYIIHLWLLLVGDWRVNIDGIAGVPGYRLNGDHYL